MRRTVLAVAAASLAAAATGTGLLVARGSARAQPGLLGTVRESSFASAGLHGTVRFDVYLPPGYAAGGRYPVVYFLHGLPGSRWSYQGFRYVARAVEQDGLRAIVVAPQGARDGDSDPEYLDLGDGRNWETALSTELPGFVDAHYRTIRARGGRALVGVSAGGYGAFLLALHHLASFAAVESWSGYFHPTDPAGTQALELGSSAADAHASAHALVSSLAAAIRRYPTLLGFYVGRQDTRFRAENEQLDRELTAARVPHLFRLYPGGHGQSLWQRQAPAWLRLALARLAPPTRGGAGGRRG